MTDLIPTHGGYRLLKSYQVARLCHDITVLFCDRFINKNSRTHDQMVQAARSGVQNIAEGSQASATSKKTELKLTQVARASLEELKLDDQDFLRQHGLSEWPRDHPLRQELIDRRFSNLAQVTAWMSEVAGREVPAGGAAKRGGPDAERTANAALALLNVAGYLLDRQVARLAADFERNGGFTERMYSVRSAKRRGEWTVD